MGDLRSYYGPLLDTERNTKANAGRGRKAARVCLIVLIVMSLMTVAVASFLNKGVITPEKTHVLFTLETVCSDGDVGQYSSLILNPLIPGEVAIAHYNATQGDLMITRYDGAWSSITAASGGDVGSYCSIDCNSTGVRLVSYYNATTGNLDFGTSTGERSSVDNSTNDVGKYSSIDVSIYDSIAISYYDATAGDLKVAYNRSGNSSWVIYTVETIGDVGLYTNALFMPMNDTIMVTYYNASDTSLKQAWAWDNGTGLSQWYNMTIYYQPATDIGKWSFQAGTETGIWYSSWYDATNGDLCYGYYSNETLMQFGVHPDTVGDVGQYTSIGCNSSGNAFISYYDNTNKDLKLAWNTSWGVWYNFTIDSAGDVGKYTSLRIDSSDAIHISYYDADNGDLKYVKILSTEIEMIPEFENVVIPIVGVLAIAVAVSSIRRRKEA